jgi:hypothetical protein
MITIDRGDVHAEGGDRSEGMRRKRRRDRRASASAQLHYVAVREILDDLVCLAPLGAATSQLGDARADSALRRRDYRAVLAVSSVNYTLKSEGEQEAITASYQAFLNGLAFPVQVLVRVVPLDLGPYLGRLQAAAGVVGQDEAPNASLWDAAVSPPKTRLHLVAPEPQTADDPDAPDAPDAVASAEEPLSRRSESESVWAALARDHVRFVRDLAARHTLLERRFYLIVPADGETTGSTGRRGRRFDSGGPRLLGWLPGRRARVRRAAAERLAAVRQQLDLRAGELIRQLGRIGLEARRLRGAELATLFASCLSPARAARHPLPPAVVHGVDRPIARATLPVVLPVPTMEPATSESWEGRNQS